MCESRHMSGVCASHHTSRSQIPQPQFCGPDFISGPLASPPPSESNPLTSFDMYLTNECQYFGFRESGV